MIKLPLFRFSALAIVGCLSFIIMACEKDSNVHIINRTSYNVYAGLLGKEYIIPSHTATTIPVDTDTQYPLLNKVKRKLKLYLIGETFQIWDDYIEQFVDSTIIHVEAGKTLSIYVDPNRAGIKITNAAGQPIKKINVFRCYPLQEWGNVYEVDIAHGESWFRPVPYATPTDNFYYKFYFTFADSSVSEYGGPNIVLGLDQQYFIQVNPPFTKRYTISN